MVKQAHVLIVAHSKRMGNGLQILLHAVDSTLPIRQVHTVDSAKRAIEQAYPTILIVDFWVDHVETLVVPSAISWVALVHTSSQTEAAKRANAGIILAVPFSPLHFHALIQHQLNAANPQKEVNPSQ